MAQNALQEIITHTTRNVESAKDFVNKKLTEIGLVDDYAKRATFLDDLMGVLYNFGFEGEEDEMVFRENVAFLAAQKWH